MISLNKKLLPKYLYKLNVALVSFFAAWFSLGVTLMVTIGCIYQESIITYAVMIATFAAFFIVLAIFCVIDVKLQKRLVKERTAELEKKFIPMPFDKAERILKERGIINDNGFITSKENDVFGEKVVVPFDKASFSFGFSQFASQIYLSIALYSKDDEGDGEAKAEYEIDCALYNFLLGKDTDLKDNYYFNLLIKDKSAFAALVLKGVKTVTFNYRK